MALNTSVEQTLKDVAQRLEEESRNTGAAAASAIIEYTRRYKEIQEGEGAKKRRKRHHKRFRDQTDAGGKDNKGSKNPVSGVNAAPQHVHGNDWREMLALTAADFLSTTTSPIKAPSSVGPEQPAPQTYNASSDTLDELPSVSAAIYNLSKNRATSCLSLKQHWIEQTFQKRECIKFIATSRDPNKCGCGRLKDGHAEYIEKVASGYNMDDDDEEEEEETVAEAEAAEGTRKQSEKWSIRKHTVSLPTDAHGTIEFQGGPHPYKAQYLRLSFDSDPSDIMQLFENMWQITPPKLIITVHGGITNFDIQHKLARLFRKGLLKAARTTGAWIITSGINAGVVRHVAAALDGQSMTPRARSKIVCIGITPWGMVKKTDGFIGMDTAVDYHPHSFSPKGKFAVLNNRHSYYLLVDNGTVGRFGADVVLRKRLETYIAQKQKLGGKGSRSVPVVSVILEGGTCTIRTVLDYVTSIPRVPVVVCDGSGRASDMLAFAHQFVQEDGTLPEGVRPQLLHLVQSVFGYNQKSADDLVDDIVACARHKNLMTVFRLGENQKQDVDHAILTALLKGHNLSASDQLALALAWNRVDIARSDIFVLGQEWPTAALNNAMMEALINDRVDFVRLLLENGVSMSSFLTMGRLEELYNTDKGPTNTLYYIVRDVVKIRNGYRYRLPHIGLAIEKLMGNAYRSSYTSPHFKERYSTFRNKYREAFRKLHQMDEVSNGSSFVNGSGTANGSAIGLGSGSGNTAINGPMPVNNTAPGAALSAAAASGSRALSNHILWRSHLRRDNPMTTQQMRPPNLSDNPELLPMEFEDDLCGSDNRRGDFRYPFSELLLWAVLTKRQEMALCMWEHGEEAMAKALISCKLYKSLAKEAAEDYLEVEICEELKEYAEQFRKLSLDLLDHCYQQDDAQTLQLLTYELKQWGAETCLSLAVIVNNKQFLAHPCCQILLADLWHGGLRIRSNSNVKVIMGIVVPFFILALEFKSREELAQQPQTAAEHEDDVNNYYASSASSSSSSDSDSSSSSDEYDTDIEKDGPHALRRRNSNGSVQSLNLASLFQSRRRRAKQQQPLTSGSAVPEVNHGQELEQVVVQPKTDHPYELSPSDRRRSRKTSTRRQSEAVSEIKQNGAVKHQEFYGHDHHRVDGSRRHSTIRKTGEREDESQANAPTSGVKALAHVPRMRPLKIRRKYYEFFAAPITSFWTWTLSFIAFMCCLTYVLLIETPDEPSGVEWFNFSYVVVFMIEMMRKFAMSEPRSLNQKFSYFFSSFWNIETCMAILCFLIGFALRLKSLDAGRVVLAVDSALWSIKLLDFMSIHPKLGPYITMAGKMVLHMFYIVTLLMVSLLAFGLPRQSITFPNEEWHWMLVRNIFYKPYFMLYGEVYADEIDTCGDEAWDKHLENGSSIYSVETQPCVPGHWVPPLLMVFFLLVANFLLLAILMATFNNIYEQTNRIAGHIWLFQRYRQVMEYEGTPWVPPPFTPLYHLWMIIKYIRYHNRCCQKKMRNKNQHIFDFSLKLFLENDQVEKLHDFEEECMEDLARDKDYKKNISSEERIHRTAERTDLLLVRMNDLASKESALKGNVRDIENRLEQIESRQSEVLDCVRQITSALPIILSAIPQPPRPLSPYSTLGMNEEIEERQIGGSEPVTAQDSSDNLREKSGVAKREAQLIHPTASTGNELPKARDLPMPVHRRTRTTTISGNEGMSNQLLRTPNHIGRQFGGSLLSLDPTFLSTVVASPTTSAGKRRTPPGSIRKRTRNDEYTSITDAISVSVSVTEPRRSKGEVHKSATEVDLLSDDEDDEDELRIQAGFVINPNDTTINTEDDDDDEEEIDRDGDDEDEVSSGGRRRSGSYAAGTVTPNSALRKAKPSFVQRQNSVMRECEEEINIRIRENRLSSVNSDEIHTNTPVEGHAHPAINDSNEYLQFKIDAKRRAD